MFCPRCKCEFRPGFTRCGSCNVDLVEDLSALEQERVEELPASIDPATMAEICGYLDLSEARRVRDRLHREGIACELAIRSSPETQPRGQVVEEYWLRADAHQIRNVQALIEAPPPAATPQAQAAVPQIHADAPQTHAATFECSHCGQPVHEEESFCAHCGTRFAE